MEGDYDSMRPLTTVAAIGFALTSIASLARADAPPLRHIVYSFSYESNQNGAVPNEAGSSGARSFNGKLDDKGTITVDVLREAQDRGLVVVVSEQANETRTASAATCAVYGNTDVVCDPNKRVNSEEYTLLRFLGANFVDPSKLDAKQHWTLSEHKGASMMTADYSINSNNNGVMTIDESRHIEDTSQGSTTINTQTNLDYDFNRLLPTSIDEYTTEDRHGGLTGVTDTTYQTNLKLVSDSMAKP